MARQRTPPAQQPPPQQTLPPGEVAAALGAGTAATLAPEAAGLVTAAAVTAATAQIVGGLVGFFDGRRKEDAIFLRTMLAREYPQRTAAQIDDLVADETARQVEFERRARARMERDLPKALREPDKEKRLAAVNKLLEREKRYVAMRQEAMAERASARAEHLDVKLSSPEGAYWALDPTVRKHTLDCVAGSADYGGPEPLGAARRPYAGKLVEIVVASGEVLPVTPNHPVLTRRGWVTAQHVRVGDDLLCDDGHERHNRRPPQQDDHVPSTLAEVFDSLQVADTSLAVRDRVGPLDFHGDVPVESEVDVVGAYGSLRYGRRVARLSDPLAHKALIGGDPARALSFAADGVGGQSLLAERPAGARDASALVGVIEASALLGGHRQECELHGVGAASSDLDPRVHKALLERGARDASLLGQPLEGFTGRVATDQVVEIRNVEFHGHVFNVETTNGWYTANGFVVANCLLMGNKFWPWEVLDKIHPLLHVGCQCHLYTKREAVERGWMKPGYVVHVEDAVRRARQHMERAHAVKEAALPGEIEAFIEQRLEEAARGPRTKQACHYFRDGCKQRATKSLIWADGRAYIPVCDEHEKTARARVTEQHDEVNRVVLIESVAEEIAALVKSLRTPCDCGSDNLPHEWGSACPKDAPVALQEADYIDRLHPRDRHGEWIRKPISKVLHSITPSLKPAGAPEHRAPLQERGTEQGRYVWLRGRYVFVPRHRAFTRKLDHVTFHSPAGGTNIYRNNHLVQVEGQGPPPHHQDLNPPAQPDIRNLPGTPEYSPAGGEKSGGEKSGGVHDSPFDLTPSQADAQFAVLAHQEANRSEVAERIDRALAAMDHTTLPVQRRDSMAAVGDALESRGFMESGPMKQEGSIGQMDFIHPLSGARLSVAWQVGGAYDVQKVVWHPGRKHWDAPADPMMRPPKTWEEFADEVRGVAYRLAHAHGQDPVVGEVRLPNAGESIKTPGGFEGGYEDHTGTHNSYDGLIILGLQTRDVLKQWEQHSGVEGNLSRTRNIDASLAQSIYASYKVATHEAIHAGGSSIGSLYRLPEHRAIEEAITEELAHVEAAKLLRAHGSTEALTWARSNPDDYKMRGTYQANRWALDRILTVAKIAPEQREDYLRDLRWGMNPGDRIYKLAQDVEKTGAMQDAYPWVKDLLTKADEGNGIELGSFEPIIRPDLRDFPSPDGVMWDGKRITVGSVITIQSGYREEKLDKSGRKRSSWKKENIEVEVVKLGQAQSPGFQFKLDVRPVEGHHRGRTGVMHNIMDTSVVAVHGHMEREQNRSFADPPATVIDGVTVKVGDTISYDGRVDGGRSEAVVTAVFPERTGYHPKAASVEAITTENSLKPDTLVLLTPDRMQGVELAKGQPAAHQTLATVTQLPERAVRPRPIAVAADRHLAADQAEPKIRIKLPASVLHELEFLEGEETIGSDSTPASNEVAHEITRAWRAASERGRAIKPGVIELSPAGARYFVSALDNSMDIWADRAQIEDARKYGGLQRSARTLIGKVQKQLDEHTASGGEEPKSPEALAYERMDQALTELGAHELDTMERWRPDLYERHPKSGWMVRNDQPRPRVTKDAQGRPRIEDTAKTPYGAEVPVEGSLRPPKYLFRAISEQDYQQARERGFLQSDGRMNLDASEGTVAAFTDPTWYLPGKLNSDPLGVYPARVVRIRYEDADGWRLDTDGYAKTNERIPFERIDASLRFEVTKAMRKGRMEGNEWPESTVRLLDDGAKSGGAEPMLLWHGTGVPDKVREQGFDFVDGVGHGGGPAIWLTDSRSYAEGYGSPVRVAAKFRKPLMVRHESKKTSWADDFEEALQREGVDTSKYPRTSSGGLASPSVIAREQGFDAVVVRYPDEVYGPEVPEHLRVSPGHTVVTAFDLDTLRVVPDDGVKSGGSAGYRPQPDVPTEDRIRAYRAAFPRNAADVNEIAATLVDEDEAAHPGGWQQMGFDRGAAMSEYLYEIGRLDGTVGFGGFDGVKSGGGGLSFEGGHTTRPPFGIKIGKDGDVRRFPRQEMVARDAAGVEVGRLDYGYDPDRNIVKIGRIDVKRDSRRQGIGSALLDRVRAQHPGAEVDPGLIVSPEGQAWWDAMSGAKSGGERPSVREALKGDGPLPMENGLYYRLHAVGAPFGPEHARTVPPIPEEIAAQSEVMRGIATPKEGYSAFWNPHHILQYVERMNWGEPVEPTARNNYQEMTVPGVRVIAFRGTPVGEGSDGEPRVMPDSNKVEARMSWGRFADRLEITPNGYGRWDEHTWGDGPDGRITDDGYRTLAQHFNDGVKSGGSQVPNDQMVYIAEGAMKRAGEDGGEMISKHGHIDTPEQQAENERLSKLAQEISGDPTLRVLVTNWISGPGGDIGHASYDRMTHKISIRPVSDKLTFLHEIAHAMVNTEHGPGGHGPDFIRTAHDLYARHISPEAAQIFWNLVGDREHDDKSGGESRPLHRPSEFLVLPKSGKLRDPARKALDAVDGLLRVPALGEPIPVKTTAGKNTRGGYLRKAVDYVGAPTWDGPTVRMVGFGSGRSNRPAKRADELQVGDEIVLSAGYNATVTKVDQIEKEVGFGRPPVTRTVISIQRDNGGSEQDGLEYKPDELVAFNWSPPKDQIPPPPTMHPTEIRVSAADDPEDRYGVEATLVHELGHFLDNVGFARFPMNRGMASTHAAWRSRDPEARKKSVAVAREESGASAEVFEFFESNPSPLDEWFKLAYASPEIQQLHSASMGDYATHKYLISPTEMWARSFAQWVALRSDHPELKTWLHASQNQPDMVTRFRKQFDREQRKNVDVPYEVKRPDSMKLRQWSDESFAPIAAEMDKVFAELGWAHGGSGRDGDADPVAGGGVAAGSGRGDGAGSAASGVKYDRVEQSWRPEHRLTDGPAAERLAQLWSDPRRPMNLTRAEIDAVWVYMKQDGFAAINTALRAGGNLDEEYALYMWSEDSKGNLRDSKPLREWVALMDGVIDRSPPVDTPLDMLMFRGVRDARAVFGADGPRVGQRVTDPAYVSTTTEYDIAKNFAIQNAQWTQGDPEDPAMLRIQVPTGAQGLWTSAVTVGREFVLPRGSTFEVVDVLPREPGLPHEDDYADVTLRLISPVAHAPYSLVLDDAPHFDPATGVKSGGVETARKMQAYVPYDPAAIGLTRKSNDDSESVRYERWRDETRKRTGQLVRGDPITPDDPRIPDTVYHATTNLPAVLADGVLRGRGEGGLGGDAQDRVVSMTTDPAIAAQIAADLHFVGTLGRDFADMPTQEWNATKKVWEPDLTPWGARIRQSLHDAAAQQGFTFGGQPPHRPDDSAEQIQRDLNYWNGMESNSDLGSWINSWFSARSSQTDKLNPIIFSATEAAKRIDPDKVGVVSIPRASLDNGALLTDFDLERKTGLKEIRSYGDVPINAPTVRTDTATDPNVREVSATPELIQEIQQARAGAKGAHEEILDSIVSDLRRNDPAYRYYVTRDPHGKLSGAMVLADPPVGVPENRLPAGTTHDDVVVLGRIAAVPAGAGTGTRLLRVAARYAVEQNKTLVGWSLPQAAGWYRKHGFHVQRDGYVHRFYLSPGELRAWLDSSLSEAEDPTVAAAPSDQPVSPLLEALGVPDHDQTRVAAMLLALPSGERTRFVEDWLQARGQSLPRVLG